MIRLVEIAAIKWKINKGDCDRKKRGKAKCIREWAETKLFELDGREDIEVQLESYRNQFINERAMLRLPA